MGGRSGREVPSKCDIYLTAFCSGEHRVGIEKATQQIQAWTGVATMTTKLGLGRGSGGGGDFIPLGPAVFGNL